MGLSDDGDENIEQRFEELCLDLNMDKSAKDEAWQAFERISTNYTLEVGFPRSFPFSVWLPFFCKSPVPNHVNIASIWLK
jgi:hypothetical protein